MCLPPIAECFVVLTHSLTPAFRLPPPTSPVTNADVFQRPILDKADADGGYNLALNLWVSRKATVDGPPLRPAAQEPFPTLRQLIDALAHVEPDHEHAAAAGEDDAPPTEGAMGSCVADDG